MKKIFAFLMAAALIFLFGACGAKREAQAPAAPAESVTNIETAPAASDSSTNVTVAAPAEEEGLNEEALEAAQACIGESVEMLFATIGEPDSSEYGSSCLVEGAEDGVLYYTDYGFYVYSLKTADGETVQDVQEL